MTSLGNCCWTARLRRLIWLAGAVMFALPRVAYSCSGPHAAELISTNIVRSLWLAAVSVFVGLAALLAFRRRHRGKRKLVVIATLAVLNPGWWFSATSGDCGIQRFVFSCVVLVAVTMLATIVLVQNRGHDK